MKTTRAVSLRQRKRTLPQKATKQQSQEQARIRRILDIFDTCPPIRGLELSYETPFQLLVATILSAQCTDERVNQVTPKLFQRFPSAQALSHATPRDLERLIFSTGFYKAKAKNLVQCAKTLVQQYDGNVPQSMESLTALPGVGRKTANVIRGNAFHLPAIVVDTHVKRVTQRLKLVHTSNPDAIEEELQKLMPEPRWTTGSQRLLLHGRHVCLARRPQCLYCSIQVECQWEEKQLP